MKINLGDFESPWQRKRKKHMLYVYTLHQEVEILLLLDHRSGVRDG